MAASDGSEYFEIGSIGSESFARASNADTVEEDEEELHWAALARLPSQKRINYAVLRASSSRRQPTPENASPDNLVDVRKLNRLNRELVVKKALATNAQDNYALLSAIKERLDKYRFQIFNYRCFSFPVSRYAIVQIYRSIFFFSFVRC